MDACTAGSGFDIIRVPAGAYTLTTVFGMGADGNSIGLPQITTAMRLDGVSAATTIIERDPMAPAFRLFDVAGSGELGLLFLTVRNGLSPNGAAIRFASMSPLPANIAVSVFDNNAATVGGGGAIDFASPFPPPPPGIPAIAATTFSNNSASTDGGAVRVGGGANVVIEDSTFTGNSATNGGAITNGDFAGGAVGTVTCTRCFFTGNSATLGGAIFSRGVLTLTDSRFSANSAVSNGGALNLTNVNGGSPSVAISGVTFNANTGGDVGAARLGELTSGSIVNSTFSGNAAVSGVGALVINDNTGPVTVNNVTVTGNMVGGSVGAVQIDSPDASVAMANTIVAGNTAAVSSPDCLISDPGMMFSSQGFNLIGDGSGCNFVATTDDQVGTGGAPIDPLLGALANNGGPTAGATPVAILTHFPQPGSPALDAGNTAAPGGAFPACAADDQIDVARPVGPRCDIGAIESQASVDLAVTKADSADPVNVGDNITYTVTVTNNGPDNATGVSLMDTLPASVNFVSATPSQGMCGEAGGIVTCNLGAIAAMANATVSIVVTTTANGILTNTVTVSADGVDTNPANNQASQTTSVGQMADLILSKADAPDPIGVTGNLTYTLTVANAGPNAASGVQLTDTLPAGVNFTSATASQGSCSQASGVVTCDLGVVNAQASATVALVVVPQNSGMITNTASVTLGEFDPDTANNSASTTTTVVDFQVSVAPASVTVTRGNTAIYTVTLTPVGGRFDIAITLDCEMEPTATNCIFSQASATPGGGPINITLNLTTAAPSTVANQRPGVLPVYAVWLLAPLGLLVIGAGRRRRAALLLVALFVVLALQAGCGGGDDEMTVTNPGTPLGTHNFTVRGIVGTLQRSTTATVVVQ